MASISKNASLLGKVGRCTPVTRARASEAPQCSGNSRLYAVAVLVRLSLPVG